MRTRRLAVVSVAAVAAVATLLAVDTDQAPEPAAGSTARVLPDLPPHRSEVPDVAPDRATFADRAPHGRAGVATPPANVKPPATAALPAGSGSGRRVVYAIGAQQVWLVTDSEVVRTYRVSGSRYDQLEAGTYEVSSKSRHATSWHGTETMEYMVRFHRGARSNIGFHDIPVDTVRGSEVQTLSDLGTPLSDGCIRQDVMDAAALWEFAPVGTPVVVVR
jgi:lipoprotein-anchoring transpeptidase ErfK/SrfK